MKKPSALKQSLTAAAGRTATVEPPPTPEIKTTKRQPKKVLVGAMYAPEVRQTLKFIEAETNKNLTQLLGHAINQLAAEHGKPEPYHDTDDHS